LRTLGIDLSADEKKTAAATIEWAEGAAAVTEIVLGLDDAALVKQLQNAECSGIDAPLGWPRAMADAVYRHSHSGEWPGLQKTAFRYRCTDRAVVERVKAKTGRPLNPLSVSSNLIAITTWRIAEVRESLFERSGSRFALDGSDDVFEVYPAAALALWGIDRKGYKGTDSAAKDRRSVLVQALEKAAPWLSWNGETRDLAIETDHSLDAVLASLVTRAANQGLTLQPTDTQREAALAEGWIHLPQGDLSDLAPEPAA
jgi:predicted nuclease with RNAse H fold